MWVLRLTVTIKSKHINCEIDNIVEFKFKELKELSQFMADVQYSVQGKALFETWFEEGEQEQ